MAYSVVPSVLTGDSWSASQHNTYIRDNFAALFPYTTAGDIAQATSASEIARLAIGTEYQALRVNSGATAIAYEHAQYANVYNDANQTVLTGTPTAVAFNSETADVPGWHDNVTNNSRITVSKTGEYVASTYLIYTGAGGSGGYWDNVEFRVNGSAVLSERRRQNIDAFDKAFSVTFSQYPMTAGQYGEIWFEQNSGGTRTLHLNARFVLRRIK